MPAVIIDHGPFYNTENRFTIRMNGVEFRATPSPALENLIKRNSDNLARTRDKLNERDAHIQNLRSAIIHLSNCAQKIMDEANKELDGPTELTDYQSGAAHSKLHTANCFQRDIDLALHKHAKA